MRKIFVDTNPIIYFLNGNCVFADEVAKFLFANADAEFFTSTITDAEILVKFYDESDEKAKLNYIDFLRDFGFFKLAVTESVADKSSRLRAKYPAIKLANALQIAAAIDTSCDVFLTNDRQLKQVSEVNVVLLDELQTN